MSRRRVKQAKRANSAGVTRDARADTPVWCRYAGVAVVWVLATVGSALLYPYSTFIPVLVVPCVIGIFVGLALDSTPVSAVVAALSAFVGTLAAAITYRLDRIGATLESLQARGVFDYAFADIPRSLLDTLTGIWSRTPVNSADTPDGPILMVIAATTLTALVALAVSWMRGRTDDSRVTRAASWLAVGLIALSLLVTGMAATSEFRAQVDIEPPDKQYAYDPVFNVKTYHLMKAGQGFREAYLYAQMMDARKDDKFSVIEDGMRKFNGGSPAYQRQPAAFYLWQVLGARQASDIVIASLVWCCVILAGLHWTLSERLGPRSIAVVALVYPSLLLHSIWFNVFFPDWWATLVLALSIIAMLKERYWTAGALGLAAALFREIMAVWLLVILAAACVKWLRDRSAWRLLAGYSATLAAFGGAFAWHYSAGARYTARATVEQSGSFVQGALAASAGLGLMDKLLKAPSYLLLPYGFYAVPGYLFLPAGSAGFFSITKPGSVARLALTGFPLAMLALYVVTGATSSYWGMHVMPFAILGTAALVANADEISLRVWERWGAT